MRRKVIEMYKENPSLISKVFRGEGGVSRISYYLNGMEVATARLLGTTIGDITVNEQYRRCGIGEQVLDDLRKRGGRNLTAVSPEGSALAKASGMFEVSPRHFSFSRPCSTAINPL